MKMRAKRIVAMLLAVAMVLGLAACAAKPYQETPHDPQLSQQGNQNETVAAGVNDPQQETVQTQPVQTPEASNPAPTLPVEDDRESLEQIVDLLGGDKTPDASKLDDEALNDLVEDLIQDLENQKPTQPSSGSASVELPKTDEEVYDEDGALTKPFDQIYPELVENEQVAYDDETLLIKMSNSKGGKITDGMKAAGVAALEPIVPLEKSTWYEAKLYEGTDVQTAVASLRALSEIQLVDYNYEVQTSAMAEYEEVPAQWLDNERTSEQWYLNYCGIPAAQNELTTPGGSSSVIVAVIDTGVDYDHEDLKDNMWFNAAETPDDGIDNDGNGYVDDYYGIDLVSGSGSADDDNGHGTHVAGIIAAQNNNIGTVGIAYNVKIMPIKAAMASGVLRQADIAKAILYAYEHGAEVINMSFGGTACSIAVQDALSVAYTRCVLVASAGNEDEPNEMTPMDSTPTPNYPAALTYVLGVMSVSRYGRESRFSNYDYALYNSREYEVYAPGEGILSTIPGDRYASWSGTSMAAPVMAAMAALLRSEYSDRDTYPTKFIYGQLTATSEDIAACGNPAIHGIHNVPSIVNLYSALTKMPQPDLGLYDYALFDTAGMEQDEAGVNTGEGVIDAGETIALGFTLRNRWGMSKDTIITIDTLSVAGIADPYITILNDSVNYGSVGTYSMGDCGPIYTDEILTGWENPFYIRISEDCPNDYAFKLNIHISCGNALDEEDTEVYTSEETLVLMVRSGTVLPSVISEDMTLTKDNLYIIPNATTILEGVTVRAEPGTHIQFWTDDENDPYAMNYVASLKVLGSFIAEGTAEEPVYIYPSELMDHYAVDLYAADSGSVILKHVDIANWNTMDSSSWIDYAERCTFRYNYNTYITHRTVSYGQVQEESYTGCTMGTISVAKDCVFYKVALKSYLYVWGNFQRCMFAECTIRFSDSNTNDCVFLNNGIEVDGDHPTSQVEAEQTLLSKIVDENGVPMQTGNAVFYNPETGTTYLRVGFGDSVRREVGDAPGIIDTESIDQYVRQMGGNLVIIETEAELQWLNDNGAFSASPMYLGTRYDLVLGKHVWHDGSAVGSFFHSEEQLAYGPEYIMVYNSSSYDTNRLSPRDYAYYILYELPGEVYITDIDLEPHQVRLDNQMTYQLQPVTLPVQLAPEKLIYESADETILTVDENGLVTPVSAGVADIIIYAPDKAVYNRVTFQVLDYVALEGLTLTPDEQVLAVGEKLTLSAALSPVNTTRTDVTYQSSDTSVATVDAAGVVTAVGSGSARITASCEEITAEVTVEVYLKTTALSLGSETMLTALADGYAELPAVTTDAGASLELLWQSSNSAVAQVEGGGLVLTGVGITTLKVTDRISGLSDSLYLYVTEKALPVVTKLQEANSVFYILFSDGSLQKMGKDMIPAVWKTDVADFAVGDCGMIVLNTDGTVNVVSIGGNDQGIATSTLGMLTEKEVVSVFAGDRAYFAVCADGSAYAMGYNHYGKLGVGSAESTISSPTLVNLGGIVSVAAVDQFYGDLTFFLTDDGKIYGTGGDFGSIPVLFAENATELYGGGDYQNYAFTYVDGSHYILKEDSYTLDTAFMQRTIEGEYDQLVLRSYNFAGAIKDGVAYEGYYNYNSEIGDYAYSFHEIPGISNVVGVYELGTEESYPTPGVDYIFIATADGMLYYSQTDYNLAAAPVAIPLVSGNTPVLAVEGTNLYAGAVNDGVLYEDALKVDFNGILSEASIQLYANGEVCYYDRFWEFDTLIVAPKDGFQTNTTYQLVISATGTKDVDGNAMENDTAFTFTYGVSFLDSEMNRRLSAGTEMKLTLTSWEWTGLELDWYSTNPGVATVEDGIMTLVAEGTTVIRVTDAATGISDTLTVYVWENEDPEAVFDKDLMIGEALSIPRTNLTEEATLLEDQLVLHFSHPMDCVNFVLRLTETGENLEVNIDDDLNQIMIQPVNGFQRDTSYTLIVSQEQTASESGLLLAEDTAFVFTYAAAAEEVEEEELPEIIPPLATEDYALQTNADVVRFYWSVENAFAKLDELRDAQHLNPQFKGNVVLNRISTDTEVTHWMRILAPTANNYEAIDLGGNYWGTVNETAIGLQLLDYTDFSTYAHLIYAPYITEAPENTFPFITGITILNKDGEEITSVSNEEITIRVAFNRDMDTTIPLLVCFGSAYPYADYEIEGSYVDARTWEGTHLLTTIIENGYQYFTVSNGCSATEDLLLYTDRARFGFVLDTTAAQALIMQGEATQTGIKLTWTQDDFDTLMGYNVYRSTAEDGQYVRLNSSVIPAEEMEFFDDTVEPGTVYYYNFTVVKTDLTESIPSGKISIMSMDTMAPNVYHSPVSAAFTGANLVLSATVTDNLYVTGVKVYYRTVGAESWNTAVMNKLNDKYSAIIPAEQITTAGLEYYIEAFDGVNFTYKASAEMPYTVTVQEAVSASSLGDINADGKISNLDALMLLQAINDLLNLNAEQFARADLDGSGELTASEALRILQYVSGAVGSVDMRG